MADSDEKRPILHSEHLEIFREIGNIGAGNATTALATMLNKRVDMGVPTASLVPFDAVAEITGGAENIVAGVMVSMSGDLRGYILLVLDLGAASALLRLIAGTEIKDKGLTQLSDMDKSTLEEITNILVGAYLSAISGLTGLSIIASVPELIIDMSGAIMSVPVIEYGKIGDEVMLLETTFFDNAETIAGHFFLVPDLQSYSTLLRSLGII